MADEDWVDEAAELQVQYGKQLPQGDLPVESVPNPTPLPRPRPQLPNAMGAQAAPISRGDIAEVYRQFQERMNMYDEVERLGIPSNRIPKRGWREGQTMPSYRPEGGLETRYPGQLQNDFDRGVKPYLLPEQQQDLQERVLRGLEQREQIRARDRTHGKNI